MDRETRKLRAKQVGMLMRAYRLGYSMQGQDGRLSQTDLIGLMAEQNEAYCENYDHSTVSRWERGVTLPTQEHLEVFGQALKLSPVEVDGLITLAGLNEANRYTPNGTQSVGEVLSTPDEAATSAPALHSYENVTVVAAECSSFDTREALQYVVSHFLIPGSSIGLAGYIVASYNWSAPWLFGVYVGLVLSLITFQGFLRMRRSGSLQELLFITVFFLLSVPLLYGPLTYMGPYGLYAIGNFAGTTIPFTLSMLVNLLIALVSALLFAYLSKWQYSESARGTSPQSPQSRRLDCSSVVGVCLCLPVAVLQYRVLDTGPVRTWHNGGRLYGDDGTARRISEHRRLGQEVSAVDGRDYDYGSGSLGSGSDVAYIHGTQSSRQFRQNRILFLGEQFRRAGIS